jgi:hypothetical protein
MPLFITLTFFYFAISLVMTSYYHKEVNLKKVSSQDLLVLRNDLVAIHFHAKKNKTYGAMGHAAEKIVSVEKELYLRKTPFDERPDPAIYIIGISGHEAYPIVAASI